MSYTLYKTNGTLLTTVVDGSLETSTDLTFVGKNYSGYGTTVNQNLVKLLENFAGKAQPTKSLTGQVWYDSTNGKLKVNIGSYYKPLANIESGLTAPTNAVKTDLWYNESTEKLNFYDGASWVVIGPQISGATANNLVEHASVADDGGNKYNVLQTNIQKPDGTKVTVAISSPLEFTVNSTEGIKSDFYKVKKGITLAGTDAVTGVGSDYVLWGNASNSLKFNGLDSNAFVLKSGAEVSGILTINGDPAGITIGNVTRIRNVDSNAVLAALQDGHRVSLQANIAGSLVEVASLGASDAGYPTLMNYAYGVNPTFPLGSNIGTAAKPFNNVYANRLAAPVAAISTATVNAILPDGASDSTLGTSANRFATVYAGNVITDSFQPTNFAVTYYANSSLRDAAFGGTIPQGTIVLCGTKFQGYTGVSWVDFN